MQITVQTNINASLAQVWECWTQPEHIVNWNFASDDWCCPAATNDLHVGAEFHYTMAAKDNSFSFDFWGTYDQIIPHEILLIKQLWIKCYLPKILIQSPKIQLNCNKQAGNKFWIILKSMWMGYIKKINLFCLIFYNKFYSQTKQFRHC